MADDTPPAPQLEERQRQQASLLRKPSLRAIGYCYHCSDDLPPGLLFCSLDCREDYERAQAARRHNGG